MKSSIKSFLLLSFTLLMTGIFTQSNAQRGDKNRSSGRSESNRGQSSGYSERPSQSPARSFRQDNNRGQFADRGINRDRSYSQRDVSVNRPNTTRNVTAQNYSQRPATVQRTSSTTVTNVYARNNQRYGYNNYSGYRGYGSRSYVILGGPRYRVIPHNYISIRFGGYPYYYNRGLFYYNIDGYYQSIYPPLGIRIGVLPYGYYPFYLGTDPYYYYNGTYYRKYDNSNYEVIDAPLGATVPSLPKGIKAVTVNGEKFYELNGTYYQEGTNKKGEVNYTVVGKNGEINNSANDDNSPASLKEGDVITQLPDGCKKITLNGEKLYVSPDDVYFKEQKDGDNINYVVVGNSL